MSWKKLICWKVSTGTEERRKLSKIASAQTRERLKRRKDLLQAPGLEEELS